MVGVNPSTIPLEGADQQCGCAIFNTSKYFQESLNAWRRKKLKVTKDKVDNSRGRENIN